MAKKNKLLNEAAARIGTAMGKANRTAHKLSKAGVLAKKELEKLIEAKAHGKKLTVMPRAKREHVPDLMSALKKSLSAEPAKKALLRSVPKTGEKQKKARKAS